MEKFNKKNLWFFGIIVFSTLLLFNCEPESSSDKGIFVKANSQIEAGRYLVIIGGCNDCHTEEYAMREGNISENNWLTGSVIGHRGPWGTSYASNLRLLVQDLEEDDWVNLVKTRTALPPMPWMNINKMNEIDSRAVYKYIKSLGAKGEKMPETVPPDQTPKTLYISYIPQSTEVNN